MQQTQRRTLIPAEVREGNALVPRASLAGLDSS